jgi:hypothetical protein
MKAFRIKQIEDELYNRKVNDKEICDYLRITYKLAMTILQSNLYSRLDVKELVDSILVLTNE